MEVDLYESMLFFSNVFVINVDFLMLRSPWIYSTVMKVVLDVVCLKNYNTKC